jgi:hypothetical protein
MATTTRWIAQGKELAETYLKTTTIGAKPQGSDLPIKELAKSVDMENKPDDDPYGIPISASLGIALIADFQKIIKPMKNFFNAPNKQNLVNLFSAQESFTPKERSEESVDLVALLLRSSAITIDKNILLKTLSQPACEGVRFYLCKKMVDGVPYLSLVTVGVTAEGQDLHYEYDPKKAGENKITEGDVDTSSLVGEYGSPPPPKNFKLGENVNGFDDKFVLLKYAEDLIK